MKLSSIFTPVLLLAAAMCFPILLLAAPGDPGPGPTGAPFDGGISMIIAAGVAYASKKAYDKRKVQKDNSDQK